MECGDNILANTVTYLYRISEALPHNLSIPKSYYASKSRILELKGKVALPTKLTTNKIRCPRCCLNFIEYPPNVRLMPKRTNDRFTKKLLRKIEEDKPLTIYQHKFKAILDKKSDKNMLARICQFCRNEIKTTINFKENQIKKAHIEHTPVIIPKKKKKKKDKFAGLTPSAVISINESNVTTENTPAKKNIKQILLDNNLKKKQEEESKLKYNVIGKIEEKKNKKKKKKKAIELPPVQSTKMKIMEKKEMKADKKKKNQIKKLLNTNNNAVNVLSGFLQSL